MGNEMQRKGSKVLLCFRQWGHVREDLRKRKNSNNKTKTKTQLYLISEPTHTKKLLLV